MGRKKKKSASTPNKGTGQKKVERLCSFGFKLQPRCGAFYYKFDLSEYPVIAHLIKQDVIPPYCYTYVDANTVTMDQCLICHMERGITPQEYEKKNEAAGITRSNIEIIKPRLLAVSEKVVREIRETRKALLEEQGIFFEMPGRGNRRDS